jgi:serine/threonine protein kinase, bacterial
MEQWEFPDQPLIRLGRSPKNDLVLADPLVSRYHLELRQRDAPPKSWELISLGSNGTFVNQKLVSKAVLASGSLIQLASHGPLLRFEIPRSDPGAVVLQPAEAQSAQCRHLGNAPSDLFCIHCGQPLRIQGMIRDYQLLRVLGRGGMGITYLVWAPQQVPKRPQLQVLKEIRADMAVVPKAQELFIREARILQSLDHPAIPRFFDFFVAGEKEYLVMELIHGQSLDQRIRHRGAVAPAQAIAWMIETCEVLEYLHCQQPPVIHRDIKPSNLLVRHQDGQIVLIDFGAVKEVGSLAETRISVEGYSAPEQGLGRPQPQSDLYAVGATLIFLLTGQNPNQFYKNLGSGYRLQLQEMPHLSASLRRVLEQATAPKPAERHASARQLAAALRECL